MTRNDFEIIIEGSLNEAIDQARIHLQRELPKGNIRLISMEGELARGWKSSIAFLMEHIYLGSDLIKPCADLIVDSFDKETTTIRVFISGHAAKEFGLNWAGGVGPFIKGINSQLIDKFSKSKCVDDSRSK